MFGMEKNKHQPFEFDLEKDLKKDRKKIKETRDLAHSKIKKIKDVMRSGASQENQENFGILLQGYTALEKVLDKIEQHAK